MTTTTETPFHTVNAPISLSRDRICGMVCGCFEGGGMSSWLLQLGDYIMPEGVQRADFKREGKRCFQDWNGVYSVITDPECKLTLTVEEPVRGDREHYDVQIGPDEIRKGLDLFAASEQYRHHWHDMIQENDDAITADVFMQFVVYGEVIYG